MQFQWIIWCNCFQTCDSSRLVQVSRKPQVIFPSTGIRLHDIHVVNGRHHVRLGDHSGINPVSRSRVWQHQSMTLRPITVHDSLWVHRSSGRRERNFLSNKQVAHRAADVPPPFLSNILLFLLWVGRQVFLNKNRVSAVQEGAWWRVRVVKVMNRLKFNYSDCVLGSNCCQNVDDRQILSTEAANLIDCTTHIDAVFVLNLTTVQIHF